MREQPTFEYKKHPDLEKNQASFMQEITRLAGGDKDKDAIYPNGVRICFGSSHFGHNDLGWFKFQLYANPVRLNTNEKYYQEMFMKTRNEYWAMASDFNRKKNSEYQRISEGE